MDGIFVGNTEEGNMEESHAAWFAIIDKDKGLIMESGLKDWHLYGKKWGVSLDEIDVFFVQRHIDAIREMEYITGEMEKKQGECLCGLQLLRTAIVGSLRKKAGREGFI